MTPHLATHAVRPAWSFGARAVRRAGPDGPRTDGPGLRALPHRKVRGAQAVLTVTHCADVDQPIGGAGGPR
jgi:hypothetical protein